MLKCEIIVLVVCTHCSAHREVPGAPLCLPSVLICFKQRSLTVYYLNAKLKCCGFPLWVFLKMCIHTQALFFRISSQTQQWQQGSLVLGSELVAYISVSMPVCLFLLLSKT